MQEAALGSLAAALPSLWCALCEERREKSGCKLLWESVSCVRRGQQKGERQRTAVLAPTSPHPATPLLPPRLCICILGLAPHSRLHTKILIRNLHMYGRGLFIPQHTSLHISPAVFTLFSHHYHTHFTLILSHISHAWQGSFLYWASCCQHHLSSWCL